jgi:hypothetical protein
MLGVFELHEPATLQEASQILAAYDSEATVYAAARATGTSWKLSRWQPNL